MIINLNVTTGKTIKDNFLNKNKRFNVIWSMNNVISGNFDEIVDRNLVTNFKF